MEGLLCKNTAYNGSVVFSAVPSRNSLSSWLGNRVQISFHENQKDAEVQRQGWGMGDGVGVRGWGWGVSR